MADTTAAVGYGSTLTGATTGAVAQVDRVAFSGVTVDDAETSHAGSTGAAKEFIPGMIDYGTIDADLVFEGVEMAAQFTNLAYRAAETWTLVLKDGTATATYSTSGYINSISLDAPHGDKITGNVGIKCTGVAVFTP